jgi:hypothetical protein
MEFIWIHIAKGLIEIPMKLWASKNYESHQYPYFIGASSLIYEKHQNFVPSVAPNNQANLKTA